MRVSHPKILSSYRIHNHILSFVDHHKYLSITIQNDLKNDISTYGRLPLKQTRHLPY